MNLFVWVGKGGWGGTIDMLDFSTRNRISWASDGLLSSIAEAPPGSPCSRSPGLRASYEALQGRQRRRGA